MHTTAAYAFKSGGTFDSCALQSVRNCWETCNARAKPLTVLNLRESPQIVNPDGGKLYCSESRGKLYQPPKSAKLPGATIQRHSMWTAAGFGSRIAAILP